MTATYLHQRFYPTLRLGFKAGVTLSKHEISVHCRQGDLDGACGLHCAAMALTLMGRITHGPSLPNRRRGTAARLWQAAQETYFDGIDAVDLAEMLDALNTNLQIKHFEGNHKKTLEFTKTQIERGGLVILAYRTKDHKVHHYVLVIGVEGLQSGRTFTTATLLALDPGLREPEMCAYNGRMHLTSRPIPHSSLYVDYVTNDGEKEPVTFTGAVSIKEAS